MGLVNKEWNKLMQSPELISARLESPGLNLLKLRDYSTLIDKKQQLNELSSALTYDKITATDLGALLARCEFPEAFPLLAKALTLRKEDLGKNIDEVTKQLIYFMKLKNAVDNTGDLLDLFTENYKKSTRKFFGFSGFKTKNGPIDLSKTKGLYTALERFFGDENVIADPRFSNLFFTKLCLVQDAKDEFYDSEFHNAAHEVIKLLYNAGDSAGLREFLELLDHVTLNNGMPLGAYSLYVPLIFAVTSECDSFIRFVAQSGYVFDHAIEKLTRYFKETGKEYDQLQMMQLLVRRVQNDPSVTVDMICQSPEVAIISGFENVLIRMCFRRSVLYRNLDDALDSATSDEQKSLLFYVKESLADLF